jgi:hypothetical protein
MNALSVLLAAIAIIFPVKAEAKEGCQTKACEARVETKRKLRVIAPYRTWFLGPVGACESGGRWGGTLDLRTGLRAVSANGRFHGRYQFGLLDWQRAGGSGDPVNAGWLEQAYRAVRWLKINGRQSWPHC